MARVLVIEDNAENLELMRFLLSSYGHETPSARSGAEGLALARAETPDLIICDIHMPGLDGFAVIEALRTDPRLASIPCIAVTALAMLGDRSKVLAAGFHGYLSKPIDPETFVTEIEQYLGDAARGREAV